VIVRFVAQIRAPKKVDSRPTAAREVDVEQIHTLGRRKSAAAEQRCPPHYRLMLGIERRPHDRFETALQHRADQPVCRARTEHRGNQDVGVEHNPGHGE
jgi:ribosomal protein S9